MEESIEDEMGSEEEDKRLKAGWTERGAPA
jgi:hypothetical protein